MEPEKWTPCLTEFIQGQPKSVYGAACWLWLLQIYRKMWQFHGFKYRGGALHFHWTATVCQRQPFHILSNLRNSLRALDIPSGYHFDFSSIPPYNVYIFVSSIIVSHMCDDHTTEYKGNVLLIMISCSTWINKNWIVRYTLESSRWTLDFKLHNSFLAII